MKTVGTLNQHPHGRRWCDAFTDGLRRHGFELRSSTPDMLVVWSIRRKGEIAAQLQRGGQVCLLECGYLGNRTEWTSASLGGGLNGRGLFPVAQDDGERFSKHFKMKRWSKRDGYSLIMGQVQGDMSLESARGDLSRWYREAAQMPNVVFRPHPKADGTSCPSDISAISGSLAGCLRGARVAVTFNSNAGVDAILAGVPTIATDLGSMAWPVASHGFNETLVRPRRDKWSARLAWCQWKIEEMASGAVWDALKTAEPYNTRTPSPYSSAAPWSACP